MSSFRTKNRTMFEIEAGHMCDMLTSGLRLILYLQCKNVSSGNVKLGSSSTCYTKLMWQLFGYSRFSYK